LELLDQLDQLAAELDPDFYSPNLHGVFVDATESLRAAIEREKTLPRDNTTLVSFRAKNLADYVTKAITAARALADELVHIATEYLEYYQYATDEIRNQTADQRNQLTAALEVSNSIPATELIALQNTLLTLVENGEANTPTETTPGQANNKNTPRPRGGNTGGGGGNNNWDDNQIVTDRWDGRQIGDRWYNENGDLLEAGPYNNQIIIEKYIPKPPEPREPYILHVGKGATIGELACIERGLYREFHIIDEHEIYIPDHWIQYSVGSGGDFYLGHAHGYYCDL